MKDKLKRSLLINLIITIVISILSFISNRYFSIYMGLETLGLMRLFTQIIAYLNLSDMGIGTASSYALYKPLAEKDENKINIIISTIDYFYKRIALLILVVGLLLNLFLNKFIDGEKYGNMLYVYWSLYVLNTAISYTYAKYSILFIANQEFNKVRIIQGTGKVIFQILQIIFLIKIQSFLIFIIIMILENIYLYINYNRHYKKNYFIKKVDIIDKNIIKDTKNLFWHQLAGVIVFNTDYIILSKFTSLSIIGVYSSYLIIYQMIMVLIGILSSVLTPNIGKYVVGKEKSEIYQKWNKLYIFYFYISTFLITCTYYLIGPFIKLWLGDEYILPKLTVILILINLFIQMTRGITETFKTVSGFFDDTYVPLLESILNFTFSLILVQKMGLNGVIIGTLISNIGIILLLKPMLVFRRCFDKRKIDYLKVLCNYLLLSFISIFLCSYLIEKFLFVNPYLILSWEKLICMAFLIGMVSISIITIVFITNKTFRKSIKKIK